MPNFLKSAIHGALDSVKSPVKVGKDLIHGDFHKAFADLKHMPGNQERANSQTFKSLGIRGWVGDHPGEAVGAAAATVLGGWAAWGAMGAGTAGGATAGATGALGGGSAAGSAMTYAPTASSVLGGSGGVGAAGIGSTGVGVAGESTASLGISGAGATSFPAFSYGSTGSLGSGTGWLGSDAAPISNSASWQDWLNRANQSGSGSGGEDEQQKQKRYKPLGNSLLNSFMGDSASRDFGIKKQQQELPQTTTQLLGNTGLSGLSFKNNFGG